MDLPFKRRILYHLGDGLLASFCSFSTGTIVCPFFSVDIPFMVTLELIMGYWIGLTWIAFCKDPEMNTTWMRIFSYVSIFVGQILAAFCLSLCGPLLNEPFSNGFNGIEMWILCAVWVCSVVVRIREDLRQVEYKRLFERAEQRFPGVERMLLLKLARLAMRSDDPYGYIDNYEFPVVGA